MRLLDNSTCRALFYVILLSLFASVENARGQKTGPPATQQQETGDVVRVSTDLVQTDVTVLDREGRFVDGLAREQFVLRVDGKPMPISFFERVSSATANNNSYPAQTRTADGARATTSAGVSSERGRKIVFFLDDLHLAADSVAGVRRSLLEFVEKEMRQMDEVAIVSASGQIGFLQQFTDHKGVLRAAIARLEPRRSTVVDAENLQLSEYAAYRISMGDKAALDYYVNQYLSSLQFEFAMPKYGRKGTPMLGGSDPAQAARMIGLRASQILEESARLSEQTFDALESFLRSSAQGQGRKLVLFISDGFFMMDKGNAKSAYRMQRVTDAAARAGSVIYTVDARAFAGRAGSSRMKSDMTGRYDKFSAGEFTASQVGLSALAETTGGRAMLESKALAPAVTSANQETFNYYLLAWRPESEGQKIEKFRQIEVSVAGRPDLTVRVPRGYLQANAKAVTNTSKTATSGRNIEVKSVAGDARVVGAASTPRLDTLLGVSYLDTPSNGAVLTASTKIGVDALFFGEDGRQPAAVDLAGLVLNDRGQIASSFRTRVNVAPPSSATGPEEDQAAVIYNYRAPLAPGIYQVRVAARDDRSGRMGRAAGWIEIPNVAQGRLALSSLLLDAQVVEASEKSSGQTTRASQVQFSVDKLFRRNSRLNFLLFIYNAAASGGADLTANIEVLRDGQAVMTTREQKVKAGAGVDMRRIPYSGSIDLKSLAAGRYMLSVTIIDHSAKTSATQQVEFRVE